MSLPPAFGRCHLTCIRYRLTCYGRSLGSFERVVLWSFLILFKICLPSLFLVDEITGSCLIGCWGLSDRLSLVNQVGGTHTAPNRRYYESAEISSRWCLQVYDVNVLMWIAGIAMDRYGSLWIGRRWLWTQLWGIRLRWWWGWGGLDDTILVFASSKQFLQSWTPGRLGQRTWCKLRRLVSAELGIARKN